MRSTLVALALSLALTSVDGRGASAAGTVITNMQVVASVDARCSVAISSVQFNTYNPLGVHATLPLDAQSTISLVCDNGRVVRVRFDQGQHAAPGSTTNAPLRRMSDGSDFIDYNLYQDPARTNVWHGGPPGVRPPGNSYPAFLTIYGRVFPGQAPTAGSYQDTIVATITF
jgi:spore coat protein U-like protein